MSAASDHVLLRLIIDSVGLQRAGFGVPMILSHAATFQPRIRYYRSIAAVGADFASDSPEFRAANVMFAQPLKPVAVAIGRAAGTVTQRYDIGITLAQAGAHYAVTAKGKGFADTTVNYTPGADLPFLSTDVNTGTDTIAEPAHGMTTGDGPFRLVNSGGSLPTGTGIAVDTNVFVIATTADTYKLATSKANALANTAIDITAAGSGTNTLQRAVNDVIIAQLVDGLNAVASKNFTAVQTAGAGQTDTMRVTANTANAWFSLEIIDPDIMSNVQSHAAPADVLLADDIAAILRADQGWYCLITLYNSQAYVLACATSIEANGRIYEFATCDSACVTASLSGGTDVGAVALGDQFAATKGDYHPSPAAFLDAGWQGGWLPTDPGQATMKFQTIALVPPVVLTDTHKVNLRARRMNSYEQVVVDYAFGWEGTVFSTTTKFMDIRRNGDWYSDQLTKGFLGVFKANPIVHADEGGASLFSAAARAINELAQTQGVLAGNPVVVADPIDSISPTDIENRNYPGLHISGAFLSAIHTLVPVTATLTFA